MLEQKTEIIEIEESSIENNEDIYLITWSPDVKELPDADFYLQHNFNVEILVDYLKCCKHGVFCVESSQLGNPHYHGWYQIDDTKELQRIVIVKTLQRFGIVKIQKVKHSYKIFSWSERANALYYYKADLPDAFLKIEPNPITKETCGTVDWSVMDMVGFFNKGVSSKLTDKISQRKFYRDFYADTIGYLRSK